MSGFRARLDYILKHNYFLNRVFNIAMSNIFRLWGKFIKIDDHLVVFSAHTRRYNDSPRTLYEYMIKHPEKYGQYKCVWALEDPEHVEIPGNAIKIKADTKEYFKTTLKAKYWITCVNIERGLHYKKKGCRYLNTWHGTPVKLVGNDVGFRNDYDFSAMDIFCCESEYGRELCLRAFRPRVDAMFPVGSPRNDELYNVTKEDVIAIKKRMNLPLDKKVILYAPTWRESTDHGKTCSIKPPVDTKKWERELGNDYVVLFRMHAYTNTLLGIEFNDILRDYSEYGNINDLLKISDILISDYSAIMTDFSILERPIVCFTYDYEEYKAERGLYIDYEKETPSGALKTEDDVIRYIQSMDYDQECQKTVKLIKNRMAQYGGNATKQCLDKLFEE